MVKSVTEKEGCSFTEPPNIYCLHSLFCEQDADITQFTEFPNTGPIIIKSTVFTSALEPLACSLISSRGEIAGFPKTKIKRF